MRLAGPRRHGLDLEPIEQLLARRDLPGRDGGERGVDVDPVTPAAGDVVHAVPGAEHRDSSGEPGPARQPLEHRAVRVRVRPVAVDARVGEADDHLAVARVGEAVRVVHRRPRCLVRGRRGAAPAPPPPARGTASAARVVPARSGATTAPSPSRAPRRRRACGRGGPPPHPGTSPATASRRSAPARRSQPDRPAPARSSPAPSQPRPEPSASHLSSLLPRRFPRSRFAPPSHTLPRSSCFLPPRASPLTYRLPPTAYRLITSRTSAHGDSTRSAGTVPATSAASRRCAPGCCAFAITHPASRGRRRNSSPRRQARKSLR